MAGRLSLLGAGRQTMPSSFTNPTDITGCNLWLDFSDADTLYVDAGTTKVSADAQAIYQVNDKSGVGNHVIQATQDFRPTYKTNIKNGLSVGRWHMNRCGFYKTLDTPLSQPNTIFAVTKVDTAEGSYCYIIDGLSDARHAILSRTAMTPNGYYCHAGTVNGMYGGTFPKGSFFVVSWVVNGASSILYENGSQAVTGNPGSNSLGAFNVGCRTGLVESMVGDYCELIVYNAALSDTERQTVENYLIDKWAIS